jgi:lysyl-tRNA synthetase class I
MPKDMTVTVKITDMKEFEKLCDTIQKFSIDERIDKAVRAEYSEEILNIFKGTKKDEVTNKNLPECPVCEKNTLVKHSDYDACINYKCKYYLMKGGDTK